MTDSIARVLITTLFNNVMKREMSLVFFSQSLNQWISWLLMCIHRISRMNYYGVLLCSFTLILSSFMEYYGDKPRQDCLAMSFCFSYTRLAEREKHKN